MKQSIVFFLAILFVVAIAQRDSVQQNATPPVSTEELSTNTTASPQTSVGAEEADQEKELQKAIILEKATQSSNEALSLYRKAKDKEKIQILADLLKNADGVAFKMTLNALMSRGKNKAKYVQRWANNAFGLALREGYTTNVAEAIVTAFTVFAEQNDHQNLLDVIRYRKEVLDKLRAGKGCEFVNELLGDGDAIAQEQMISTEYVQAFYDPGYVDIMECFLKPCEGNALRCCQSNSAIGRGMCQCSEKKKSRRCDYNLFLHKPRPIWICTASDCVTNEKCLCP